MLIFGLREKYRTTTGASVRRHFVETYKKTKLYAKNPFPLFTTAPNIIFAIKVYYTFWKRILLETEIIVCQIQFLERKYNFAQNSENSKI